MKTAFSILHYRKLHLLERERESDASSALSLIVISLALCCEMETAVEKRYWVKLEAETEEMEKEEEEEEKEDAMEDLERRGRRARKDSNGSGFGSTYGEAESLIQPPPDLVASGYEPSDGSSELKNGAAYHFTSPVYEVVNAAEQKSEIQNGTALVNHDKDKKVISFEEDNRQYAISLSYGNMIADERVEYLSKELQGKVTDHLDLGKVYDKPGTHNFYCPNCKACITKVIIVHEYGERETSTTTPLLPREELRCTSCFSFLIPIGNWFFSKLGSHIQEAHTEPQPGFNVRVETVLESPQESNAILLDQHGQAAPTSQSPAHFHSEGVDKVESTTNSARDPTSLEVVIVEGSLVEGRVNGLKGANSDNVETLLKSSQEPNATWQDHHSQAAPTSRTPVPPLLAGVSMIDSTTYLKRDPSLLEAVFDEGSMVDGRLNLLNGQKGNVIENIRFGTLEPSQVSKETPYKLDIQAVSINEASVPHQQLEVDTVLTTETKKSELVSNANSELVSPFIVAMNVNNEMILQGIVETNKGNKAETIGLGSTETSEISKETPHEQESQPPFINNDPSHNQPIKVGIILTPKTPKPEIDCPTSYTLSTPLLEAVIAERGSTQDPAGDSNKGEPETDFPVSIAVISGTQDTTVTPESRENKGWEILKSLVYGGLVESITSLGIVTSAASADVATANIVALALANLIGGIFIIGHNLIELKNDQSRRVSNETDEQVDRYQNLLGQRRNFILHFSVAILSFLVFGLVPPLVYGFSFRESNNGDLKLAAVAGASLVCITLLALGKAHIQKPSKWQEYIKTVLYYVAFGLGVSGLSYLAGDLIQNLIQKLGWFESSSAVAHLHPLEISQ